MEGRVGRWIRIGKESNPLISPPDEMVQHFKPDFNNPSAITHNVYTYLKGLVGGVLSGKFEEKYGKLTDLVFDGITELGGLRTAMESEDTEKYATFGGWKADYLNIIQLLEPSTLDANVFATARIGEARKGRFNNKTQMVEGADPEWLEDKGLIPEVDGWARKTLANHFNFVFFTDQVAKRSKQGQSVVYEPQAQIHLLPDGDYTIKNQGSHAWAALGLPDKLINPNWSEIEAVLDQAANYVAG